MFENLGKLKYLTKKSEIKISLNDFKEGVNFFDNFIAYKRNDEIKLFNRKCDHAGGKIISKDGKAICPIHMWKFDPSLGTYENGVKKKEIKHTISDNVIKFFDISYTPQIRKYKKNLNTQIRFLNHAFLKIFGNNFSFSTDPWAIGPAFNTGWWLKKSTKNDWLYQLNNSNFIYISHNHPDHLHPLTLSKVDKDVPIVVPNFKTKSTEKYIKDLGFKNIHVLDFNNEYKLKKSNLIISILKSGDFREDSGIYFSNGEFTGLLSVDANTINFDRLPKANFYGASFAGGASGYPLMFDNYDYNEKLKISLREKNFVRKKISNNLNKILPNYFMPYAGFFTTKLKRDNEIARVKNKNAIEDYANFCKLKKIKLLNVLKDDLYQFKGTKLINKKNIDIKITKDLEPEKYLEFFKKEYKKIDKEYIKEYFLKSKFSDNLLLYICLTDDNFKSLNKNYLINFSKNPSSFEEIKKFSKKSLQQNQNLKKLVLKVRKESFLNVVYNKLPWEDLSIGFQCKVIRNPNLYNIKFWHHFTNIYTTSQNIRVVTECGSCEKLNHFFDNQIHKSSLKPRINYE